MEIIIVITKKVATQSEGLAFAVQARNYIKDHPVLSDESVRVEMELRAVIKPE